MSYITIDEFRRRCSEGGFHAAADRDNDTSVSKGEKNTIVQLSIDWGMAKVDAAVCDQVTPGYAQGQRNQYLMDLCFDLSFYRLSAVGGREVSQSIRDMYNDALESLEKVRKGGRIPGFAYPTPVNSSFIGRVPRVRNVR